MNLLMVPLYSMQSETGGTVGVGGHLPDLMGLLSRQAWDCAVKNVLNKKTT